LGDEIDDVVFVVRHEDVLDRRIHERFGRTCVRLPGKQSLKPDKILHRIVKVCRKEVTAALRPGEDTEDTG
jgi:hypothetical protein